MTEAAVHSATPTLEPAFAAPPAAAPAPAAPRLARVAARGVAWALLAAIAARLVSLLSLAVLARLLSPAEFGLVAFALVYMTYVETVADLGAGAALIWWPREREDAAQVSFVTGVTMSALWVALTVLAAPYVAAFFRAPAGGPLLRALAFALLLKALGNTHDALCQKDLRFRARVVPELGGALTKAALSVGLAAAGFGAWSLAWGHLGGQAAWTALTWRIAPWRPRWRWPAGVMRPLLGYGRAIVSVNVLSALVHHADLVIVGRLLGAAALGLYQVAYKLPETAITVLVWVTSRVLFPALSRLNAQGESLGRGWLAAVRWTSLLTLPAAAALAVLAEPIVLLFFGPRWAAAAPVLSGLAVAAGLRSAGTNAGDVLKASGRPGLLAGLSVTKAALLLPALLVAARSGPAQVAWTLAAVTAATAVLSVAVSARHARVPLRDYAAALLPAAGVALLVAAAGGLSRWMGGGLLSGLAAVAVAFTAGTMVLAPATVRTAWQALAGRDGGARRAGRIVAAGDDARLARFTLSLTVAHTWVQRVARRLPEPLASGALLRPEGAGAPWPRAAQRALAENEDLAEALREGRWVATERVTGRRDQGALLALFAGPASEPAAALKLRPLADGGVLRHEAEVLRALRGRLPHALAATIPLPLDYVAEEGWEALLLPWMAGRSPYVELHGSFRPDRHVHAHLRPAVEWLAAVQPFLRTASGGAGDDRGPVPRGLAHGDFWVRNLLLRGEAVTAVLDWEHAQEDRPMTDDLFHLLLTYGLGYRWLGRGRMSSAEAFRCAFTEPSPVAREMARAIGRFAEVTGLDRRALRAEFERYLASSPVHHGRAPVFADALRRARWSAFAE
ncbi:MAG TPA: oligosaccharide flippase family protein [Vicinamibacteria bacterium]|nr:oligosaccharide flippase family protein [Vicinamibacteria bacterium]